MFDIGFFELSLIGVVALVVIGPERLPGVARTAGKWVGRANRFVSNIKEDISKEIKDEELQKILQQQKDLANDFKQAAEKTGSALNQLNPSEQLDGLLEIDESNSNTSTTKKKKSEPSLNNDQKNTVSIEEIEPSKTTSPKSITAEEAVTETNN